VSNQCPSCGRAQVDGLLCDRVIVSHRDVSCTARLEHDLAAVPNLLRDLDTTLARQSHTGPALDKVTGKGETALAYSNDASKATTKLRDVLTAWAQGTGMPWAAYSITAAAHLLARLNDLRSHADADKLWTEITTACDTARIAIDIPANRTTFPVGPCPENDPTTGAHCPGTVVAFIPTEDDRPGHMRCKLNPDHQWPAVQWYRTGRRILDRIEERKQTA
jgi:hypothetical protein